MNATGAGGGGGASPYLPNGQQYYHPMTPQPGNPPMQLAADQRYAALRLQQAVKAGVIPASVLNAHPNTYPALWRMVSEKVSAPANAAGYKDPGYWLRMGGPQVGGQGGVDTSQVPGNQPPPADLQQQGHEFSPDAGAGQMLQQYIQMLQSQGQGGQMPQMGNIPPQLLQALYAQFQQSQGGGNPNINSYGQSIS